MKGQQIITCPNCGENKVKNSGIGKMFLWFAVISAITIIGIPLAIVFFLAWIFVRFVQKDHLRMICMQCKHIFKVDESTYDRYKQALHNNELSIRYGTRKGNCGRRTGSNLKSIKRTIPSIE